MIIFKQLLRFYLLNILLRNLIFKYITVFITKFKAVNLIIKKYKIYKLNLINYLIFLYFYLQIYYIKK